MTRQRAFVTRHAARATPEVRARILIVAALWTVLASLLPLRSADPIPATLDKDTAFRATASQLATNQAAPAGPAALAKAASNLVTVLNPGLTQVQMRQSPAFRQKVALATASFLNPSAAHSERMQDPSFQQKYQAAMAAFSEASRRAKRPVPPSATDSNLIQALRADPAWRQQREKPVRLLLLPATAP